MDLRITTFNIRNGLANDGLNGWKERRHLTVQAIQRADPDMLGLQEVFDFQLEFLLSALPEYEHYSVGRDDGASEGEHCSILWKRERLHRTDAGTFWLSDTPSVPGSTSWGNHITRICSWVRFDEGFTFYNTHWDHESTDARRRSAELLASFLPATPCVLLGDFNSEPDWPDMAALAKSKELNFLTKNSSTGTFHDFRGGTNGEKIDHIFASRGIRANEINVDTTHEGSLYPSDHYPVSCIISLV